MEYLLLSVITFLISTISGNVEISFMKAAPRLNNELYCDYYFACHAEGETLQWKVNNNNISDYSGQNLGHVFTGSISTCIYTTTLLSLKPLPLGLKIFDSLLIVYCRSGIRFDVTCTNGSVSSMTSSPEKSLITKADSSIPSVNLELVLTENLVATDASSCTNIFVCGVDNNFLTWLVQDAMYLFTNFDSIGVQRLKVQGNIVEQQGIFVGNEPYSLVAVMIVIGSEEIIVTCGYHQNTTSLVSNLCSTSMRTTGSETNTVGEFSTMASEGSNNLPLILSLTIPFGVLVVAAVMVLNCYLQYCCKARSNRNNPVGEPMPSTPRPLHETGFDGEKGILEKPLRDSNFSGIKKPKKRMSDICYNEFFKRVKYILLTRNENAFNAATVILTAPDIENTTNEQLTCIEEGVYVGMIGSHPVCLVYETENNFVDKIEDVIIKYFSNVKFLVFVGRCFRIDKNKVKLADIVISSGIHHATTSEVKIEYIAPEIRSMFCFYPENVEKFNVTEDRRAKYFVGEIASGVRMLDDPNFRRLAPVYDPIYGCVESSGELLSLFKNGIDMGNNITKQIQVITIGAVSGFVDGDTINECDEWQFMASQAAFHYVTSKMIKPHAPGKISYKIKKPKPTTDIKEYKEFCDQIKFIISSNNSDAFDAATTKISAPNINGDTDDIIQIDDHIYIGMIGSHRVGLLSFRNKLQKLQNIETAIIKHFPCAKYLLDIGGCICTNRKKANLGDVLISEEICHIKYDGIGYSEPIYKIATEIKDMFCYPQNVDGLELPGNRIANHFSVRIASARDIGRNNDMKKIAITSPDIYAYEVIGGELLDLREILKHKKGLIINVILVNGVISYEDCEKNTEWVFVATQAAFHYVSKMLELQKANAAL